MADDRWFQHYKGLVEPRLNELLPPESERPSNLFKAMRYSVLGGGKRLRPALTMAASFAAGGSEIDGLDVGCAAEFVHCFSLIHDDLPAIDNDDLRRGQPTVHKIFGEAIAVLSGDALFALAFEVIGSIPDTSLAVRCLSSLARATGGQGLVGGEVLDVEGECAQLSQHDVETIHRRKTGALISSCCEMGGIVGGGNMADCGSLAEFGMELGFAFQIVDDILNETSSIEVLGKSAGSDKERNKSTFPALLGIDESRKLAHKVLDEAILKLSGLSGDTRPLIEIALSCVERES